ncbi:MAG: T9SS type A sorting domain-containing protein [Flavobacteriales bacterium]|nr:T9SS type A sorting domain-containing protein [Flavobacteriales bacterium]
MAVWHDSLYVCGRILTVDDDTVHQVAQWIGGDAVENCTVGISEPPQRPAALQVMPNGVQGQWSVHLPSEGAWHLVAYNMAGQTVGTWQTNGQSLTMDLASKSSGLYLLRATNATGQQRTAKLIHH